MAIYVAALCVGFCSGIIGVLVDTDHLGELSGKDHRFAHKYMFMGACVLILSTIAYITGLVA